MSNHPITTLYVPQGGALFHGTERDDLIYGTETSDDINGRGGDDVVVGKGAPDALKGGDGDDRLYGGLGNDYLSGGNNEDALYGNDGTDYLKGNDGNDQLNGGEGDDILNGDRGNDLLWGDKGRDIFLFSPGSGHDVIYDFSGVGTEDHDKIYVETIGETSLDFMMNHITYADGSATVQLTHDSSITLIGISEGTLTGGDFRVFDLPV